MPLSVHWFLPTGGDGRGVTGFGAGSGGRAPDIEYLSLVARAADRAGFGTFLAGRSKARIMRNGLAAFAVVLGTFALLRTAWPAYLVVLVIGFAYFATVTSLNTVLQEHLDDRVRGRVMSLWLMAFGGTVPLSLLAAGPVAEATSITVVLLYGAAVAAGLAVYAHRTAVRET